MKTIKKQLFVALVMMLVAAVALGTATYAWFVNNAAPSVAQMDFTASTATALEVGIDKAADAETTPNGTADANLVYVGTISNDDVKAYNGGTYANIFSSDSANLLAPASIATFTATAINNKFYAATGYDAATWNANTFASVTPGAGSVKKIPLWFRSTSNMSVFLKNDTTVVASNPGTGNALANEIDKALRIAFVEHAAPENYVICDINGNPLTDASKHRNTTLDDSGVAAQNGQAIAALTADPGTIDSFATQTRYALADLQVADSVVNNMVDVAEAVDKKEIFTLSANTPKLIDVYIWLEGCDFDCVNEIAAGALAINLKFIGGAAASGTAPTALGL